MATPIGHSLAGYAVLGLLPGRLGGSRLLVLVAVTMANAPDLDFLPGLLVGAPALYHQGPSHSLAFALMAGLLAAFALRGRWPGAATFAVAALAYGSHLALDMLCPDARPPYGIPLAWPLNDAHVLAPVALLSGVRHAPTASASTLVWVIGILDPVNLRAVALELLLVGPFAYWAWHRQRRPRAAAAPGPAYLVPAPPATPEDRQP